MGKLTGETTLISNYCYQGTAARGSPFGPNGMVLLTFGDFSVALPTAFQAAHISGQKSRASTPF
jgi:hypothetical protein